jgi:hypothetical protein
MRFEKVGMEKLEDLVKTRIQVLRAANKLDGGYGTDGTGIPDLL